jgi:pimeloyl-ACP methyl ester carboxylesterase
MSAGFSGEVVGQSSKHSGLTPIDKASPYIVYLPGRIVQPGNLRPVSPQFGVYEYEEILKTFSNSGFLVFSEPRAQTTDVESYAKLIADGIRQWLKAGVPAQHITVVGASQGSWIAMLASTYLKNRDVNFVLISACSADPGFLKLVDLHGNILSIYERTDLAQSCLEYREDATGVNKWKEIEVNTGLKHGFLFRPLKEWTEPTIAWAKR